MKPQSSGLSSSGKTQPKIAHEPRPSDRYKDNRGLLVTVTRAGFNRVTFMRDGYSEPCIYPRDRFIAEFTLTGEQTK